ncbi:FAD-binding protein [Halospeciosus flavus]|uniref:FAD-binding protein n=1 Tax=Halospeciosus flavus TaxID=3032283 RepID=A0ABD5Z0F6_9EURY|nr:FAD-binding protein [Halospeciosus flavus]
MTDEVDALDVLVVGGGPAGAAAAVFTARAGLDTRVYNRGPSALSQCAHLSNYLGFPEGIDVETFDELTDAHVRAAGGTVHEAHVETVHHDDSADAGNFRAETDTGEMVHADRVVAATRQTATYLDAFEELFADGSFDADAVDADGRTPVEGLYVAGPRGGGPDQALVAAGHGARVGHAIAVAAREDRGYWPDIASEYYDWTPRESAFEPGWEESVADWIRGTVPDGADVTSDTVDDVVAETVDHERESALSVEEIDERRREAQHALLDHLDDDVIREYLDSTED